MGVAVAANEHLLGVDAGDPAIGWH
jgi:hypothetical protein